MQEPSLLERFRSIFDGYRESFVKHVPPFTDEDGSGKMKGRFIGLAEYRSNSAYHPAPPEGVDEKSYVPVTTDKYHEHLNGGDGLAISPLCDVTVMEGDKKVKLRNVCYWGVIDIDVYDVDFSILVNRMYTYGYKFSAFISKSGGLHLYFVFSKPESAKEVRDALNKIVELFGLSKVYHDNKGKSRVEVFPEHATRTEGQHDKYVFLPFYNIFKMDKEAVNGKMLTAQGMARGIEKGLVDIENNFTSVKEITEATGRLPFADAPYCIQSLLISGALQDGNHRNDFLFNATLYLKLKYKDGLKFEHLEDLNSYLGEPKPTDEIQQIFSSANKDNFQLAGRCGKQPVCDVCDKQLCKLREFGVGKKKNNVVSTVEFGSIVRVLAEEPYYLWEARYAGTEEWKTLRIDGAENLLNQRVAQTACIKVLNTVPPSVTMDVWEDTVRKALANIKEVPAPKATDTTELAELRESFNRYLTHRRSKNAQPYHVNVKQVYYKDGAYYFKTDGFQAFLRSQNFKLGRTNLREELLRFGCEEGAIEYTNGIGEMRAVECWKKVEDDHLKKLDNFYDDIMEADELTLMNNKLNKGDDGKQQSAVVASKTVDDPRF